MPPRTVNPEEMFARNTLDLEWRVTRRIRLADSDSLGYVQGAQTKGSVVSMAIAIRSNSQISYPILSAGAFTELLGHSDVCTTMIYTHVLNRGPAGAAALPTGCSCHDLGGRETHRTGRGGPGDILQRLAVYHGKRTKACPASSRKRGCRRSSAGLVHRAIQNYAVR